MPNIVRAGRLMLNERGEFRREYQLRLPLPIAQLYCRANDAKSSRDGHDHTFYLLEAYIKLAVAPLVASYRQELVGGGQRVPIIDKQLAKLALPSLGDWVGMFRELARHFGNRADAATHPLGRLWRQLEQPHRDLPAVLALFRRIKNGPDGQPVGVQSCSLLELFDAWLLDNLQADIAVNL